MDDYLGSAAGEAARHPSTSTTTSARLPAERRHPSSSTTTSAWPPAERCDTLIIDDHFGSATSGAAAPLVVNVHLGLVAERSCSTHLARRPHHAHRHLSTGADIKLAAPSTSVLDELATTVTTRNTPAPKRPRRRRQDAEARPTTRPALHISTVATHTCTSKSMSPRRPGTRK